MNWKSLLATVFLPYAISMASVASAQEFDLAVTFSDKLQSRMAVINHSEQLAEKRFRDDHTAARTFPASGTQRFAALDTASAEWAGERLIGDVSKYTLENLVRAMTAYNVTRAAPDFNGRIELTIDRLHLSNPNVALLEGPNSYARGRIRVLHADGNLLHESKVHANLVIQPTTDRAYNGPKLAFSEIDPSKRVGPTLAQFVERALEQAWPERKRDIVGPVIVRISDPNETLIFN